MLLIDEEEWLQLEEIKLFQHIMVLNQDTLAFEEDQRGTFKESYFSSYIIPVEPHTPWQLGWVCVTWSQQISMSDWFCSRV